MVIDVTQKRKDILGYIEKEISLKKGEDFILYINDVNHPNLELKNVTGTYFQTGVLYPFLVYSFDQENISYKNFEDDQYWFNKNDTYYLVSYDTTSVDYTRCARGNTKTRELWLFKWTGDNWVRATDAPLQYDYVKNDSAGIWSHNLYHACSDKGGAVYLCENGTIMIVLTYVHVPNRLEPYNLDVRESVVNLVPIEDGNYHVAARMMTYIL